MNLEQIFADIDRNCKSNSVSYKPADKLADVNLTLGDAISIALEAGGTWQYDDTNHLDYPIVTTALVSGQRDYSFTTDEQGNQILDIYRVEIVDSTGLAIELSPIDQFDIKGQALTEFMKDAATPLFYDKTANGIVLYPEPNYTNAAGLKIYYNRTPDYFLSTDTTKKPGIPDVFHEYLALRPSYQYCLRKGLPQTANIKQDMLLMEEGIRAYYNSRSKDEKKVMSAAYRSSR